MLITVAVFHVLVPFFAVVVAFFVVSGAVVDV